jgi:hypothetical protein
MKKIHFILIGLLLTTGVIAQAPQKLNYQAVVRNTQNELVSNTTVSVFVSIIHEDQTVMYSELHSPQTNANGLFTIQIGGGTPNSGDFASIAWANGPFFLKTEIDITGGSNFTISTTNEMLSVPYALYAGSSNETDPVFNNYHSYYRTIAGLNSQSVTVSNEWTNLYDGIPIYFTKYYGNTNLEITASSTFYGGSFDGASAIQFQIRVDDVPYLYGNLGVIKNTTSNDFLTLNGIFQSLSVGSHVVSIWAKTDAGNSIDVIVDPGGWGGAMIIKETR